MNTSVNDEGNTTNKSEDDTTLPIIYHMWEETEPIRLIFGPV
jgi:hypothetical protein